MLLCSVLFVGTAFADDFDKPFLTKRFPAASIAQLDVQTSGGSIEVLGTADGEAVVEVYIRPSSYRGKKDDWTQKKIQEVLDKYYKLEVELVRGELLVSAKRHPDFAKWTAQTGLSISFKIRVKQNTHSNLKTSGGSIRMEQLSGTQRFSTSGGSLRLHGLSGYIEGRTSGGSIKVYDSKDQVRLSTSGGSLEAQNCRGDLDLRTSGGSVNLSNLEGTIVASTSGGSLRFRDIKGNLNATTSGGSVQGENVEGVLKTSTSGGSIRLSGISGDLEASNSGGGIQVSMRSVKNYVYLRNSGSVTLNLPGNQGYDLNITGSSVSMGNHLRNFSGRVESRRVEGSLNGGGPRIELRSSQKVSVNFE